MNNQKIFFSYSRQDSKEFALQLYNDLKHAGADVWIDLRNIKAGANWDVEVGKALEACEIVLFIVSNTAIHTDNVLDEVYYAKDAGKQVLPIVYSFCPVPYRLHRLQRI